MYAPIALTLKKLFILPTKCIYVFRVMLVLNSVFISLNRVNRLVIVMETACVVCEWGTAFLCVTVESRLPDLRLFDIPFYPT
jgi:hypothetical protein